MQAAARGRHRLAHAAGAALVRRGPGARRLGAGGRVRRAGGGRGCALRPGQSGLRVLHGHADGHGQWSPASAIFDDAFTDARVRGSVSAYAIASIFHGYLHIFTGDLAEAGADLRNAVEASEQHGLASGMPYALSFLADTRMQRGRHGRRRRDGRAARSTVRARAGARSSTTPAATCASSRGATATHWPSSPAPASSTSGSAGPIRRSSPGAPSARSPTARWGTRRGADARRRGGRARPQLGAPRALAKALRVAGMIEGGKAGLGLLEEAVEVAEGSRAVLERARGLIELGSALRRSNRRADAREHLRQALELAHQGESVPLVTRAQETDGDRRPAAARSPERPRRAHPERARVAGMAAEGARTGISPRPCS